MKLLELEIMKKNRGFHIDGEMFNKWRERVKEAEKYEREAKDTISHLEQHQLLTDQKAERLESENAKLKLEIELLKREQKPCEKCAALREDLLLKESELDKLRKILSKKENWPRVSRREISTQTEEAMLVPPIVSPPPPAPGQPEVVDALQKEMKKLHEFVAEVRAKEHSYLATINALKESLTMINPELQGERDGTELVMAELNEIRQLIDDSPHGGFAWDHVMQCGLLSAACALKQRVMSQAEESKKMKERMGRMIEYQRKMSSKHDGAASGSENNVKSQSEGEDRNRSKSMLLRRSSHSNQGCQSDSRRGSRNFLQNQNSITSATHR